MAKANSQPFRGTFVLMIFMTFWVLLVTAAADSEKYPNGKKGKQMNIKSDNSYYFFQLVLDRTYRSHEQR